MISMIKAKERDFEQVMISMIKTKEGDFELGNSNMWL